MTKKTTKHNTDYLMQSYEQNGKKILVGFSLGTVGALEVAKTVNLDRLILISPSPVYDEVYFEDSFIRERKSILFEIEKCCDTIIYYGEKEIKEVKETAKELAENLNCAIVKIKGAKHDKKLVEEVLKIEGLV